jgi:hypothetical protein
MDITQPITYRGLNFNNVTSAPGSRVLRGISVESADYSEVPAVGYVEKRAASDGMHASDVYLGARQIVFRGHIYASSPAEFFDYLHILRSVFSPTSAYTESPGDKGFLPLEYTQPTLDTASFPGGVINLQLLARPLDGSPRFDINRDRLIGISKGPTATEWSDRLFCKDPRVYVTPEQIIDVSGIHTATTPGEAKNRGDYETPLNIMLIIGGTAPGKVGDFHFYGFGADMHIKIENIANRVYRWFGDDRVLMVQDSTVATNPFVLRNDLVTFMSKNHKPMVPAHINPPSKPFKTVFSYTCDVTLAASSRLFWYEAFA